MKESYDDKMDDMERSMEDKIQSIKREISGISHHRSWKSSLSRHRL